MWCCSYDLLHPFCVPQNSFIPILSLNFPSWNEDHCLVYSYGIRRTKEDWEVGISPNSDYEGSEKKVSLRKINIQSTFSGAQLRSIGPCITISHFSWKQSCTQNHWSVMFQRGVTLSNRKGPVKPIDSSPCLPALKALSRARNSTVYLGSPLGAQDWRMQNTVTKWIPIVQKHHSGAAWKKAGEPLGPFWLLRKPLSCEPPLWRRFQDPHFHPRTWGGGICQGSASEK